MSESYTNIIDDLRLLEAPQPLPGWAWGLLAGTVLGVAAFLIWRRQARAKAARQGLVQPEIAYEDALAELEKIRHKIATENSRVYGIEVSGIIRRYLERRFGLYAPRRSTEEFLMEARSSARLESKYRSLLGEFLGTCDFLKFARGRAEISELEKLHAAAVRFVTETHGPPAASAATQEAAR